MCNKHFEIQDKTTPENCQMSCKKCNRRKSGR
ncbi:MAG: HNH endonuclease [Treponema sp.]|nr:HNH endonuclease [Treponema sp.]